MYFKNCSLKNTFKNCSLKKCISKLLSQKYISQSVLIKYISKFLPQKKHFKSSSKQFKVKNHCCCLTKNVSHNYLVRHMCMILINNDISKNYDLKHINITDLIVYDHILVIHY